MLHPFNRGSAWHYIWYRTLFAWLFLKFSNSFTLTSPGWRWLFIENHTSWWRHQMEAYSPLLAICAGNSPVPVNFPHKGQWRGALMFPLICTWINGWVNSREAGDLRRHSAHYDVIIMISFNAECGITCFSWFIIPTARDILLDIFLTWEFQVIYLIVVNPNSFTRSKPVPFIFIFGISQSLNILCLNWNNIYFVLETFRNNLLTASRSVTFFYLGVYPQRYHYCDAIMTAMASQITCLPIVYSTVNSDADQRKHQSSAPLAFVRGIHRGPVNSPHKWPVTRKMFPFDYVIMIQK